MKSIRYQKIARPPLGAHKKVTSICFCFSTLTKTLNFTQAPKSDFPKKITPLKTKKLPCFCIN